MAVIVSIIDHLRHSYRPRNSVLVKSAAGHWRTMPVTPGARTEPRLVIYRFGTSLYFANTSRLLEDLIAISGKAPRSAGSSWTARRSATWTTPPPRSSAAPSRNCTSVTSSS